MKNPWVLLFCLLALAARAEDQVEITRSTSTLRMDLPFFYYMDGPFLKPVKDALPWDLFAATKENTKEIIRTDGSKQKIVTPEFQELKKYDSKEVTLYGYMFSMVHKGELRHFIFGPYQPNCPFHYHVRLKLIVSVHMAKPIVFTAEPILLHGTLKLEAAGDAESYYILEQAVRLD